MEVIVTKSSGFCYGVSKTVNELNELIMNHNGEIYCYGEIVHNKTVIEEFIKKGVKFVNTLDNVKDNVVLRAHGIRKEEYQLLNNKNVNIIDLTCPNVLNIHNIANEYSKKNYFIILIGHKTHPETIGTFSFCGENSYIIDDDISYDSLEDKIISSGLKDILVISQTTFNSFAFDNIVLELKKRFLNYNFVIKKTICNATEMRQNETQELSKKVQLMIIIGDKSSSNSNKLYEIARENCDNVLFVENKDSLDMNIIKKLDRNSVIGISAGASTPKGDIDSIINLLKNI